VLFASTSIGGMSGSDVVASTVRGEDGLDLDFDAVGWIRDGGGHRAGLELPDMRWMDCRGERRWPLASSASGMLCPFPPCAFRLPAEEMQQHVETVHADMPPPKRRSQRAPSPVALLPPPPSADSIAAAQEFAVSRVVEAIVTAVVEVHFCSRGEVRFCPA
jgi:hypothetical protein